MDGAWNIYASILLLAKPSKALEMLGCQCIIASLNLRFPITTWMTYDIKFRTLAASYPSLRWDILHLDTWAECISMPITQPEHWPCPHCGSMYHYPQRCPFHTNSSSTDANRQLPVTGHATHSPAPQAAPIISFQLHLPHSHSHQSAETSITDAPACKRAVSSAMFASSAMDHILNMLAQSLKWGSSPLSIDNWGACTPLWPLALECELSNHPDKTFIQLLLSDIRQGCNIGYTGPYFTYTANNLQSAFSNPLVLDNALHSEWKQCRKLEPFNALPLPILRCSGLGIVPKHDGEP